MSVEDTRRRLQAIIDAVTPTEEDLREAWAHAITCEWLDYMSGRDAAYHGFNTWLRRVMAAVWEEAVAAAADGDPTNPHAGPTP